ncbi:Splicing factor 3B subunit 2 [Micractinium conductrix]|uniref:Splicing factor 3B subunit 2 n=1 Tax=Micractinium conductrix TaxID=554055 RepID=A0A2P6VKL4_9CHLO|nr:Splicing factor 3B subunit 2 [Micractinium conductrix]|eukprot:PSC74600.1 Splicing factor 3B subunit 2 [Micractinium conductrix]
MAGTAAEAQQNGKEKPSKAQLKKAKAKQRKERQKAEREALAAAQADQGATAMPEAAAAADEEAVEIEYVSAPLELDFLQEEAAAAAEGGDGDVEMRGGLGLGLGADPAAGEGGEGQPSAAADFQRILQRFGTVEELLAGEAEEGEEGGAGGGEEGEEDKKGGAKGGDDGDSEGEEDDEAGASRKKKKLASRLKIAELKQSCERPDVVEVWDVTAADPKLLVYLKSYRNTVHVPRHWSHKRKYLQGKMGIEKPPFKLPDFIEATGIGEMRQAYLEKAEGQKMKQKARERMQPKMGKLDIDYQVLHDAFFKYQTKPKLAGVGEMYYEGKEFEASITHARPGVLSAELQNALGMGESAPPPWLINMQRYGPPPSYPALKVPGLNAPIPPGGMFGYHPGGWGKPPVDEFGRPIYGNVFGAEEEEADEEEQAVDKVVRWGELESEEEESDEEEEEEEESDEEGDETESLADGYASVASGLASSLPSGIETPAELDLRKASEAAAPKQLYTVLEQQKAAVGAGTLMGSEHTYVIPGKEGAAGKDKVPLGAARRLEALRREMPDVDVALDPAELEGLDDAALRELYEMRVQEQRSAAGREDFSDMVAAKAAQQKRKAVDKGGKDAKKFKF